ncbi:MAG: PD-(D/E)XK nuclease family protein [Acidimicrobiia bacterium]|nr:PD-(D/E)XK nuclease family protein [Acidimicrobiia bacterium]
MTASFTFTSYGAEATAALGDAIAAAKGGDPLAPVTVVVPSNLVGVAARRSLAAGPGAGGVVGLAAVRFETLLGLAKLLAGSTPADDQRRRVSDPVVGAAVRTTLADSADLLRPVAHHPATERALVRVHRELRELDDSSLDTVAATGPQANEVVRLHRLIRDRLAKKFIDEVDLHRTAAGIDRNDPLLAEFGVLIVHVPGRTPTSGIDLLAALAASRPLTVIAARTGDEATDEPVRHLVERLGGAFPSSAPTPMTSDLAVRSVADPDEEARVAVREVVAAAATGTPFPRMAIVHPGGDRYARLLHQHLKAADVPFNSVSGRRLDESLTGRTLKALLDLNDHDFSRTAVMALASSGAVVGADGNAVPAAAWERLAREAGIVAGASQWRSHLERLIADRAERLTDLVSQGAETSRTEAIDKQIRQAQSLLEFVEELVDSVDPATVPGDWPGLAGWAVGMLERYLGSAADRTGWPDDEVAAHTRVVDLVRGLGSLGAIETRPGPAAFRRAVGDGMDRDTERDGRFGDGVLVGGFGVVTGLDLDRVVVIGMAEGTTPTRRREDPLLPDAARLAADGALPVRTDRLADLHHSVLAAMASARQERILVFPRGDLGKKNEWVPSRWLLDQVEAVLGSRPSPTELENLDKPWFSSSPSFVGSLERLTSPADEQEYALAELLRERHRGLPVDTADRRSHDSVLDRGIDLIRGRQQPVLTRYDGNLAGAAIPSPAGGHTLLSATRLQTWVRCPHAYFMEHVLRVGVPHEPQDDEGITAMDRGTLAHEVLDRFIAENLGTGDLPAPGTTWSNAQRQRLAEICDEEFTLAEARGLTGRGLLWQRDSERLRRHLDSFLVDDHKWRAEHETTPVAVEMSFGLDGSAPLVHVLPDGRSLRFRGRIDRVDTSADGTIHVIDYKTGRKGSYTKISETTPDDHGQYLQIPVYGLAARAAVGTPETEVHGQYWFITDGGEQIGHTLSDPVLERFDTVLTTIIDGIENGLFPARPPKNSRFGIGCDYCNPDAMGTDPVATSWETKRVDPLLEPYRRLIGDLDEVAGSVIDLGDDNA